MNVYFISGPLKSKRIIVTKFFTALSLFTYFSFSVNAGSFILNDYNLITLGDFETTQHVDGSVFVGGDLIANQSIGFFGKDTDSPYSALAVAGKITGNTNTPINVNGNLEISAENTITTFDNNNKFRVNGHEIQNSSGISLNTDLVNLAVDYKAELEDASLAFKNLDTNSTVDYFENKNYKLNIDQSLGEDDYAIFSLDDMNNFFSNTSNQEIDILANNISDIAGIIINVSGITLNQASNNKATGNFSNFKDKIIWNFYEATTLSLGQSAFIGTLLAPLATVTAMGDIDGSVGVDSLITTREIHIVDNDITPPTSVVKVNEPTTLLLFVFAFIALARRFTVK